MGSSQAHTHTRRTHVRTDICFNTTDENAIKWLNFNVFLPSSTSRHRRDEPHSEACFGKRLGCNQEKVKWCHATRKSL